MKTLVIGAGPAGIISAINARKKRDNVVLVEQNDQIGKKLKITGKGRCNITSSLPIEEFYPKIFNSKFLYSAFNNYSNKDIIEFLNKNGIKTKIERGNRYFPVSDNAKEIVDLFYRLIKKINIDLRLNTKIIDLIIENNKILGAKIESGEIIYADKIVIATGGKSYPQTGSDGKMLEVLEKYNVGIEHFKPALCPIELIEHKLCTSCMGLSLKNIGLKLEINNKCIYKDQGEAIFTHYGLSGPLILTSSSYISHHKEYERYIKDRKVNIIIDLKPGLNEEKLNLRLLRDCNKYINKEIKNALFELLPKNIIPLVLEKSNIDPNTKVNNLTKNQRLELVKTIKNLKFKVSKLRPIDESIISNGGVLTKYINPKTMQSKQIENLYFAGEIIDCDGLTGGFNLQIAYSTGVLSGVN